MQSCGVRRGRPGCTQADAQTPAFPCAVDLPTLPPGQPPAALNLDNAGLWTIARLAPSRYTVARLTSWRCTLARLTPSRYDRGARLRATHSLGSGPTPTRACSAKA